MDIFTLAAKLTLDSSSFDKGIEEAEGKGSKLGNVLGGIGNAAKTTVSVAGAALAAAGSVVAGLTKSAVQAYGEYEQLTGGIETLFGTGGKTLAEYRESVGVTMDSNQKKLKETREAYRSMMKAEMDVMKNAHEAYKTAGVDANTYMQTVTSFSASLISSLGGDTEKAAEVSHMAMVDMADNANKMGTDMGSIQNAYQGFAKQNYTMLDNLKLGYGGTRSEMQRLLKDAQKLTGKKYNIKNLSDVYEAIHAIQDELGITGTTAKEASTTIQGSVGQMKAAWTNLKIAFADPNGNVDEAIRNLVDSAKTAASNIVPAVGTALRGIGTAIKELAPVISAELPNLIGDVLPDLVDGAVSLVSGLTQAIIDNAPMIFDAVGQILQKVGDVLKNSDSPILQSVGELIGFVGDLIRDPEGTLKSAWESVWGTISETASRIWEGIKTAASTAWEAISSTASTVWEAIAGFITGAIDGASAWLSSAWETIKTAASTAWDTISSTASTVWETIKTAITTAIEAAKITLVTLWDSVKEKAITIWNSLKGTAETVWNAISDFVTGAIDTAKTTLATTWTTISTVAGQAWNGIKVSAETAWNAVSGFITGAINGAKAALDTAWSAIQTAAETVWNAISSTASSIWEGIKGFITDPITTAKNTLARIWESIKAKAEAVWNAVSSAITPVIEGISSVINGVVSAVQKVIEWFGKLMGYDGRNLASTTSSHTHTDTTIKKTIVKTETDNSGGKLTTYQDNSTTYTNRDGSGASHPFAKGEWDVPYDNYPAMLHRNEMVLTASQARRYREGEDGGGINMSALAQVVAQAVREGMRGVSVNSYLDGKNLTDEIMRIAGNNQAALRYV